MATSASADGRTYEDTISMEPFHFEIHEGEAYNSSVTNLAVNSTGVAEAFISTGPIPMHFNFAVASDGKGVINFFGNSTASDTGTPVGITNMNQSESKTSTAAIGDAPVVTGDGTSIGTFLLPIAGTFTTTDILRSGTEWILSPSSFYLIRFSNAAGTDVDVTISAQWYEQE